MSNEILISKVLQSEWLKRCYFFQSKELTERMLSPCSISPTSRWEKVTLVPTEGSILSRLNTFHAILIPTLQKVKGLARSSRMPLLNRYPGTS